MIYSTCIKQGQWFARGEDGPGGSTVFNIMASKKDKKRPPLKPREGPYLKTNAYTMRPSFEQILTIILMIILILLHSIFNVKAIIAINHSILWTMFGFHYAILLMIIFVYVVITVKDPVDEYLLEPDYALTDVQKQYCDLCRSYRKYKSYHCKRCRRCTQDFDHHCKYLNNCIGGKNYSLFLMLLIAFIIFNLNSIGQAVWVFVASRKDRYIAAQAISEWVSLVIIVESFLLALLSTILCIFHFYISLCLDVSTLEFYQSTIKSSTFSVGNDGRDDTNGIPMNAPSSANNLYDVSRGMRMG